VKISLSDKSGRDELLSFDVPDASAVTSRPDERLWQTTAGDLIGVFQFRKPPDIPRTRTVEELEAFYRSVLPASNKLVEIAIIRADGINAVRILTKSPLSPSGFVYRGSITVPFGVGSFVFSVDCSESSPTGMREAILADRLLAAGAPVEDVLASSALFDSPEYDGEFPSHPISRARKALHEIETSVKFAATIQKLAPFPLPATDRALSTFSRLLRRWTDRRRE